MITKEASLSPQERDRRHRALREAMAGAGYDVLLFASLGHDNQRGPVRYVSNWRSPTFYDYALLPLEGEMTLCTHYPKYVDLARGRCGVEKAVATPYGQEDSAVIAKLLADWGAKRRVSSVRRRCRPRSTSPSSRSSPPAWRRRTPPICSKRSGASRATRSSG